MSNDIVDVAAPEAEADLPKAAATAPEPGAKASADAKPTAEAAAPPTAATPVPPAPKPTDSPEVAKLRDQLLRTAADYDNYRKRARKEQDDALRRGREGLLKDLLPVFDNLDRAATHAETAADAKSVSEGLRIVLKQFTDTLDRIGLKRVQSVGHPFDPSIHEAIQHLESKDHPAGVVLAEVQSGYAIGDYLLRAALVVVSKGPPEGDPATS